MSRRRTSWSRCHSVADCATPWKVCSRRGAAARTVSPSPIRFFRRSRVSPMKHSWPESGQTLLELPTRHLWRFSMRSSAQLDNTANRSLCESPRKSPNNNGADRAGITSETPEVVLYFLQQMFHTFGLSRRLIDWPASFDAGRHVRSAPSFTLFCVSCCSKGGRNARRGNHLTQAADASESAIRNEFRRNRQPNFVARRDACGRGDGLVGNHRDGDPRLQRGNG